MKKKAIVSLLFVLLLTGYFLSRQVRAEKDPTFYCWFNEAIKDCDTGGMWVCYGVYPPDCNRNEILMLQPGPGCSFMC
jgi:hypothetical protein